MGRYIDWADLTNRYRAAAQMGGATELSPTIDDAEAEVDARLGVRYAVPFGPSSADVPQIVRTLSIDIAYYRLIYATEQGQALKRYIDERITGLISGTLTLTTSAGVIASSEARAWTSTDYRSAFGPDDPINWSVSAEAIDAAQQEREND